MPGQWFTTSDPDRLFRLDQPHIGLLAGAGRFPIVVAEALVERGVQVTCVGLTGLADPVLADICQNFTWKTIAKLGGWIRFMRRHGVREATMAGKVHKGVLFEKRRWLHHLPDWRMIRCAYRLLREDFRDDTLLLAVVDEFAQDGIRFVPATDFAPELLVKPGQLTSRGPTPDQWRDIEFGWALAKEMGRLDVGQSVVVKDRAALAIEAIEGTDNCIRRAGQFCRSGGFTVVKVAKPEQDMRFDVPTIGVGTLESMLASGGHVLAVEAGRTIVIDQPDVIEMANRHGLVVMAVDPAHIEQPATVG